MAGTAKKRALRELSVQRLRRPSLFCAAERAAILSQQTA
jgi:hypothetical protein